MRWKSSTLDDLEGRWQTVRSAILVTAGLLVFHSFGVSSQICLACWPFSSIVVFLWFRNRFSTEWRRLLKMTLGGMPFRKHLKTCEKVICVWSVDSVIQFSELTGSLGRHWYWCSACSMFSVMIKAKSWFVCHSWYWFLCWHYMQQSYSNGTNYKENLTVSFVLIANTFLTD